MAIPSLMNPGMSSGDLFRQNMRQRLGFGSSPLPSQAPVGMGNTLPANPNTGIIPPGMGNSGMGATNPSAGESGRTPTPLGMSTAMGGDMQHNPYTPMGMPPHAQPQGLLGMPFMPHPQGSQPFVNPFGHLMAQHYPWMFNR